MPALRPLPSSRSWANLLRVVPIGRVVSYETKVPFLRPLATSFVAASIQPKSGTPWASTKSGTTITTICDLLTASAVFVVAMRAFDFTTFASFSCRKASPGNGSCPELTRSTVAVFTSHPMTSWPFSAN